MKLMTITETPRRRRSNRALANDRAIRQAAIAEVLRVGVDRVSLRDVGLRAGLTHGATYARYEEVEELLVDLWNEVLEERLGHIYDLAMRAAEEPSEITIGAALDACRSATNEDVCAIHLLVAAHRIPTLQEETEPFVTLRLRREDCESSDTSAIYTRGLTLFSVLIARILGEFHFGPDTQGLLSIAGVLLDAFKVDPADVKHIPQHPPRSPFIYPGGDDLKSQLASSTIQVIGKSGYTNATMSRIARRASCSPGAIYKVYASKEELVVSTYLTTMKTRWIPIDQFTTFLDEGVLSQFLHDVTSVENAAQRNFVLEFAMAATNVQLIREALLAHPNEMYSILPHLEQATDDEIQLLKSMIRLFNHLTMGATMLAVTSNSFQCSNFSQFTEPFREAILARTANTWQDLSQHLLSYNSLGDEAPHLATSPLSPPMPQAV